MSAHSSHEAVAEAFLRLRRLPPGARDPVLDALEGPVRDEVRAMLEHDDAPHPLVDLPSSWSGAETGRPWMPDRIDRFTVVRRIGEGAMGVVFEALQDAPARRVALKALLPGRISATALQRFEHEARALARLEHPNIARIYQIGAAQEGRLTIPFIVMDLIDGLPLTRYAESANLMRDQRLALLASVADAVQHAHQKGIIHRDLKPTNILVDAQGSPRILDFGLARLIGDEAVDHPTLTGEVLGTPPYLGPEQGRGDWRGVDTRSDIYSLGVLLIEAICGKPTRAGRGNGDPQASLTIPRSVQGDLRAVMQKAVAIRPEDRYSNASELAADLRRLLNREPVSARSAGLWRRCTLFVRRHRAASFTIASLVIAGGVAGWQAHRAHDHYRTLRDLLLVFRDNPGKVDEAACLELLARIRRLNLGGTLEDAEIFMNIGAIMRDKAYQPIAVAEELVCRAVAIRSSILGPTHIETLKAHQHLAGVYVNAGRSDLVEREARLILAGLGDNGPQTSLFASAHVALANAVMNQGRHQEALDSLKPIARGPLRTTMLHIRAFALCGLGQYAEAEECWREVDRLLRATGNDEVLFCQNLVALARHVVMTRGDTVEADRLIAEAERCAVTSPHPHSAPTTRATVAGLTWLKGDLEGAERVLAYLAKMDLRWSPIHDSPSEYINMYGVCLRDQGRYKEAEPWLRSVLEKRIGMFGEAHASVANSKVNLAKLLVLDGRASEGLALAEAAFAHRARVVGAGSPEAIEALALLGHAKVAIGRTKDGFNDLDRALEVRDEGLRENWVADLAVGSYVAALELTGDHDKAEALLVSEAERASQDLGRDHLITTRSKARLDRFRSSKR